MTRTIHLAHSPDSDDAFMFYALADGQIDTQGIEYIHELQDIETLNGRAMRGELDVTAVSIHAYAYLSDHYALLPHGASMGDGYGPMLVARIPLTRDQIAGKRVAVPGMMTSAYLALKLYQPDFIPVVVPFDQIEQTVLRGDVDAGLLIHEGQLTYGDDGLEKCLDLGEWWLLETGLPLPLGVNVVRRDLGADAVRELSEVLRESIEAGLEHREEALEFALGFGRGLDGERGNRFIDMYVNGLTQDYGDEGRQAVRELLARAEAVGAYEQPVQIQFVE